MASPFYGRTVRFLGLSVRVRNGAPNLRAVLIDVDGEVVDHFHSSASAGSEPSDQILAIADDLQGRLAGMEPQPTRVVLRLGSERQGHGTAERQQRTRAEGAVMYVARRQCPSVTAMLIKTLVSTCGTDKDTLETEAAALLGQDWAPAASAAMAARALQDA